MAKKRSFHSCYCKAVNLGHLLNPFGQASVSTFIQNKVELTHFCGYFYSYNQSESSEERVCCRLNFGGKASWRREDFSGIIKTGQELNRSKDNIVLIGNHGSVIVGDKVQVQQHGGGCVCGSFAKRTHKKSFEEIRCSLATIHLLPSFLGKKKKLKLRNIQRSMNGLILAMVLIACFCNFLIALLI